MTTPRLTGRTAIVTGSTSGIGAAVARTLAAEGAHVVVTGRDAARGDAVVKEIREAGGRADVVVSDLAGSYAGIRGFAAAATDVLGGRVDILVNNAGIYPATRTEDLADDDLDAMLAVNVRAPHVLVAALAPAMAARGDGVIITVGSWMARVGIPFADIARGVLFLASDDAAMVHGATLDVDGGMSATRSGWPGGLTPACGPARARCRGWPGGAACRGRTARRNGP